MLTCDVSADREEPWRRLLQGLSEARRNKEEYLRSRRRVGIWAESVWLVPKRFGGGVAVVYLETSYPPERVLDELAASEAPFDSWYGTHMRGFSGLDLARAASGELLFAWRDDEPRAEREEPSNS